jgi:hypothetical protein
MKNKLLFAIAFALLCSPVKAQTYYPMPKNNATWTVVEYGYGTMPPETGVWHFGLSGDTIISAKTYAKIYWNPGSLGNLNPEKAFNLSTASYYGAFREDAAKKVWYKDKSSNAEYLLYDFGLNLGDTFCFYQEPCGVQCHAVSLVDSIKINGSYRKRIHFTYNGQKETWIEGIGSAYDNWTGKWCFIGNIEWKLNCYKEKGIALYGNCDYPTGIKKISGESFSIKIFPNPVTDHLTVETEMTDATINVETIFGEIILTQKMTTGKTKLNLEFLSNGIYILRCSTNQQEHVYKLVKQ